MGSSTAIREYFVRLGILPFEGLFESLPKKLNFHGNIYIYDYNITVTEVNGKRFGESEDSKTKGKHGQENSEIPNISDLSP